MKQKITLFLVLLFAALSNPSFAQQDGSIDITFNPTDVGGFNELRGNVNDILEQTDGKVIIAGGLVEYLGEPIGDVIRLNADETLDETFNVMGSGPNNVVNSVLQLPDGKLLIGGSFTAYNDHVCNGIARLNTDGTFDTTFNAVAMQGSFSIMKLVLAPGEKIVCLLFVSTAEHEIIRLNSDGSVDNTFANGTSEMASSNAIAVQDDGKILVAGGYMSFNGLQRSGLARLNSDGSVDLNFQFSLLGSSVMNVLIQGDGKIVINSQEDDESVLHRYNVDGTEDVTFTTPDIPGTRGISEVIAQPENKLLILPYDVAALIRINSDGSYDTSFNAPDAYWTLKIKSGQNGKIYLLGSFVALNDDLENGFARLNSNGSRDASFDIGPNTLTGADGEIEKVLNQPDNKLIISGVFHTYNGASAKYVARLLEDGTLDAGFNPDPSVGRGFIASAIYPDGKIVVVDKYEGYIKRLNTDGSIDTSFNALRFNNSWEDFKISQLVLLPDGKIVVGGSFTTYGETNAYHLCKLNSDGSLDTTFNNSLYANAIVDLSPSAMTVVPGEEKILIAFAGSALPNSIYKLHFDGRLDTGFTPVPDQTMFWVNSLAVEHDGKILVEGYSEESFYYREKLIRLNTNGTINQTLLDFDFVGGGVSKIVTQPDGKYYIIANYLYFGQSFNRRFARYNNDATIDNTFLAGETVRESVSDMVFQGDKIVVAGSFYDYNGAGRNRIARLHTSGALTVNQPQSLYNDVYTYKSNNAIQVESLGQAIKEVQVYDMAGRLLSDAKNVNAQSTTLQDVLPSRKVLIVNTTLADNTKVSKKIYY